VVCPVESYRACNETSQRFSKKESIRLKFRRPK
jgi:hypothetical protein